MKIVVTIVNLTKKVNVGFQNNKFGKEEKGRFY